MEEGTSFIVVPIKLSTFKPSTFPRFFGKFSTFEHPKRSRHLSNFKLQIVFGRHTRFLQSLRVNDVRLVKCLIDKGNSFIHVSLKLRTFKPSMFPKFFGKFSTFKHPKRSRHSSNFKLQMELGRHMRFLQSISLNEIRPIKRPINEGNSFIAVPFKLSTFRLLAILNIQKGQVL